MMASPALRLLSTFGVRAWQRPPAHYSISPLPVSQALLGAFARPKPDAPSRPHWNLLHLSLGHLSMLSAWITICTGIYMAHTSPRYQVG